MGFTLHTAHLVIRSLVSLPSIIPSRNHRRLATLLASPASISGCSNRKRVRRGLDTGGLVTKFGDGGRVVLVVLTFSTRSKPYIMWLSVDYTNEKAN